MSECARVCVYPVQALLIALYLYIVMMLVCLYRSVNVCPMTPSTSSHPFPASDSLTLYETHIKTLTHLSLFVCFCKFG